MILCLSSASVFSSLLYEMSFYCIHMLTKQSAFSYIQSVSKWSDLNQMAQMGRRINSLVEVWCLVCSRGLPIRVSIISIQKSNIGWPQHFSTERISDISEKLDFWWSIQQKSTSIGHLGVRYDPTIRTGSSLMITHLL